MARRLGGPVFRCCDIVALVWVEMDVRMSEGGTKEVVWMATAAVGAKLAHTPASTNARTCEVVVSVVGFVVSVWVELDVVVVDWGSVWVLASLVLALVASLAFTTCIISSNASLATVYPSSGPKSIPFFTPSSNFSSVFIFRSCNNFLPFS